MKQCHVLQMGAVVLFAPVLMSLALLIIDSSQLLNLTKFAFYYCLVVLPASFVLGSLLLGSLNLSDFDRVVLGYPAAIGFYSTVFYISSIVEVTWFIWLVALMFLLVAPIYLKKINLKPASIQAYFYYVLLYLLVATLFFITFSLTTFTPSQGKLGLYYQDILWTVGNTWAIVRDGFPVTDARFDDSPFAYHMAQNIYMAMVTKFTGIDPFFLHLRIAPLYDLFFLVGAIYVGAQAFLMASTRFAAGLTFTLFFTAATLNLGATEYLSHIYINPLSMFFGLAAYIIILFLIGFHCLSDKVLIGYTSLVALVAFASKASLVFSLMPALVFYVLFRSFKGYRIVYRDVILAFTVSFVLLLLSWTIYKGADGGLIRQEYTAFDSFQIKRLSSIFGQFFAEFIAPYGSIAKPLIVIAQNTVGIILSLYVLTFALIYVTNKKFRKEKGVLTPFFVFILAISFFSVLWLAIFQFPGGAVYFVWYSVIAWIIPFNYACHYMAFEKSSWLRRGLAFVPMLIGCVLFVSYTSSFFMSPWWQATVNSKKIWDERATVSEGEWLAMQWVKHNLPKDIVLMSDRRGFFHEGGGDLFVGRFFGYSALSGKQLYNEGDDFNRQAIESVAEQRWQMIERLLSSTNPVQVISIWKNIPADYLIVSKRFTKLSLALKEVAPVVFENTDVVILARPS